MTNEWNKGDRMYLCAFLCLFIQNKNQSYNSKTRRILSSLFVRRQVPSGDLKQRLKWIVEPVVWQSQIILYKQIQEAESNETLTTERLWESYWISETQMLT